MPIRRRKEDNSPQREPERDRTRCQRFDRRRYGPVAREETAETAAGRVVYGATTRPVRWEGWRRRGPLCPGLAQAIPREQTQAKQACTEHRNEHRDGRRAAAANQTTGAARRRAGR